MSSGAEYRWLANRERELGRDRYRQGEEAESLDERREHVVAAKAHIEAADYYERLADVQGGIA